MPLTWGTWGSLGGHLYKIGGSSDPGDPGVLNTNKFILYIYIYINRLNIYLLIFIFIVL